MKPVITFLMVLFTILVSAQKTYNLDQKPVKTKEQQIGKALITSDKAIYKKLDYNVYKTEKGKLFIVYPNKENTGYNKKYIKEST